MRFKPAIRFACWLVLLVPIVVTSSGTLPSPWYQFDLRGVVRDPAGSPLANYAVVALEDSVVLPSGWGILKSCRIRTGARDVALTNVRGEFSLHLLLCYLPDSVAVGVVLPDTVLIGSRMYRALLPYERRETDYERTQGSLCEDPTSFTHLDGYVYDPIDSLSVVVP